MRYPQLIGVRLNLILSLVFAQFTQFPNFLLEAASSSSRRLMIIRRPGSSLRGAAF